MNGQGSFVSQLTSLVPPPKEPFDTGSDEIWTGVQEDLGVRLPTDLREFCTIYGNGCFQHPSGVFGIRFLNPMVFAYKRDVKASQSSLTSLMSSGFDTKGLFEWGSDELGSTFTWRTDSEPDSWPVVLVRCDLEVIQHQTSMTGFLVQLFSGKVDDFSGQADHEGNVMTGEWFQRQAGQFFFKPAKAFKPRDWPPLLEAAWSLDQRKVRELLSLGVDPNSIHNEETPLFSAIESVCSAEIVEILLEAGADPNVRGEEGRTPLQLAAAYKAGEKCLRILLAAGADPKVKDDDGRSALLEACAAKNEGQVRALLEHGADPNDRQPDGKTAIQLAKPSKSIRKLLREAGATGK